MRLRPRARSSDLEEARRIAQRLEGGSRPDDRAEAAAPGYVSFAAPAPREDAPTTPSAVPVPEDVLSEGETVEPEPEPGLGVEAETPPEAAPESESPSVPEPVWQAEPWEGSADAVTAPEPEGEPVTDALVGAAGEAADVVPDAADASSLVDSYDAVVTVPPGEPDGGPSLDTLLVAAQAAAGVEAAMVIDAGGDLLASCGEWPAVGAARIAGKLLPLVAGKLAEPGTMVPVKMAGQVLTAWRLELAGGLATVAMLAPQAVSAAVRSEVDAQLAQGGS